MAKSAVNHVPTVEARSACKCSVPDEWIEAAYGSIMIDQRKELLGKLVLFGCNRWRLAVGSGPVDRTGNCGGWCTVRIRLNWRSAYNGGYLLWNRDGGCRSWMLSDIEAIGSNWLHLHNVIALSSSASSEQDNQKKTKNKPEFLASTHNYSVRNMECHSKIMFLFTSVAHGLHKRVSPHFLVVLLDWLTDPPTHLSRRAVFTCHPEQTSLVILSRSEGSHALDNEILRCGSG